MILNKKAKRPIYQHKRYWLLTFFLFLVVYAAINFPSKSDLNRQSEGFYRFVYFHSSYRHFEWLDDVNWLEMFSSTFKESLIAKFNYYFLNDKPPHININLDFETWQAIKKERSDLRGGQFIGTQRNYYKGGIQYNGEYIPIKLRLKGGQRDHIDHPFKWSFRVKTRNGESLFGMRRFSIQHPKTRAYQIEKIYHHIANQLDIIALRYDYIDVSINGESIGLMAIEEHFSTELLENNRRKEGLILKLDEKVVPEVYHASVANLDLIHPEKTYDRYNVDEVFKGPYRQLREVYYNALNAPLRSLTKTENSTLLQNHETVAHGLFQGMLNGTIAPSKVFDANKMGLFYATQAMWGNSHNAAFRNIRFYFNPYTYLYEPIAFDSNAYSSKWLDTYPNYHHIADQELNRLLLNDKKIEAAYIKSIYELGDWLKQEENKQKTIKLEEETTYRLRQEYWAMPNIYLDSLEQATQAVIADIESGQFFKLVEATLNTPNDPSPLDIPENFALPKVVNAYYFFQEDALYLRIHNFLPLPVELSDLNLSINGVQKNLDTSNLSIAPYYFGDYHSDPKIKLGKFSANGSIEIRGKLQVATQNEMTYEFQAIKGYPSINQHPLATTGFDQQVQKYPFIKINNNEMKAKIKRGKWLINDMLIFPKGLALEIEAGAQLNFKKGAGLILRAPIIAKGNKTEPIKLLANIEKQIDHYWSGLTVINANGNSYLEHVYISDVDFAKKDLWQLTGAINFYQSDVYFNHVYFSRSSAEDFLNIIDSDFEINNSAMENARSDGFDGDFVAGSIINSSFTNIGGDGIDFSGSSITTQNCTFSKIGDKALSIGEKTTAKANAITISNSSVGIAVKDGSDLTAKEINLEDMKNANFMSYNKKNEYGPATLLVSDATYPDLPQGVINQRGNSLSLNGKNYPGLKINIDKLYKSGYMQKNPDKKPSPNSENALDNI